MSRKVVYFIWCILMVLLCIGCADTDLKVDKVKDLDYTVLGQEEQPESLSKILEEKKTQAFEMTYVEGDFLYLCVGYGEQKTGGYSIKVEDCYLGEDCIFVNTTLIGPTESETAELKSQDENSSYPFIVLKTEYLDKTVVFD